MNYVLAIQVTRYTVPKLVCSAFNYHMTLLRLYQRETRYNIHDTFKEIQAKIEKKEIYCGKFLSIKLFSCRHYNSTETKKHKK